MDIYNEESSLLASNNIDNKKEVLNDQTLPARARLFLKSDFNTSILSSIEEEKKSNRFIVRTEDGMKFEFDENGIWLDVDCNGNAVPTFIIPAKIKHTIGKGLKITQIRRYGKNRFEVRLSNATNIRFDKHFKKISNLK